MPWARFDDGAAFHRKIVDAGNEAVGAWWRMVVWACGNFTGGHVSERVGRLIAGNDEVIETLLGVRLLEPDVERGGWQIHDFATYQPSPSHEIDRRERISEARREAGRRGAAARWGHGKTASQSPPAPDGKNGNSHGKTMAKNGPDPDPDPSIEILPSAIDREVADDDAQAPLELASPASPMSRSRDVVTRERAEELIAKASAGRFVAGGRQKGGTFKLDKARRADPTGAIFERVGRWLAAGGDGWRRGRLDGRALADLDAWIAQATAWDGFSPVDDPPRQPPAARREIRRDPTTGGRRGMIPIPEDY